MVFGMQDGETGIQMEGNKRRHPGPDSGADQPVPMQVEVSSLMPDEPDTMQTVP